LKFSGTEEGAELGRETVGDKVPAPRNNPDEKGIAKKCPE